jgi:hypothetical protein
MSVDNFNVNDLRREREESANVQYIEFSSLVRSFPNDLVCFYEGQDADYYIPRIKNHNTALEIHSVKCRGMKYVLKVHQLISFHREYDKYKKAFFVDRDFNVPLAPKNPPIFQTPCYSVENFYVSVDTFKEILKHQLNISATQPEYATYIQLFKDRQKEFHQAACLFNAWYACLIEIKTARNTETGVNLKEKLPTNFITFSLEKITQNYGLQQIKMLFDTALEVEDEILNKKNKEFENCQQHLDFRGKYELQFLINFIDFIILDSKIIKKYTRKEIKFTFYDSLSIDRAISIFSSYAYTPESLNNYIKEVIKN